MELKKARLDYKWVVLAVCFLMEFLCLGSPLGELLRKLTGSYRSCFWLFGAVAVCVIAGFQIVLGIANKTKAAILAAEARE